MAQRTVTFEGKQYNFPADATDEEIGSALGSYTKAPTYGEVLEKWPGAFKGQLQKIAGGAVEAVGDLTRIDAISKAGAGIGESASINIKENTPPNMTLGQDIVSTAATSLGLSIPAMGLGLAGAPLGVARAVGTATTAMGLGTAASEYSENRAANIPGGRAALHSAFAGAVEKYTEYLPAKYLFGTNRAQKSFIKDFLGTELLGEEIATILQDINAKLSHSPHLTLGDIARDMVVTAGAVAISAPVQAGLVRGAQAMLPESTLGGEPGQQQVPVVPPTPAMEQLKGNLSNLMNPPNAPAQPVVSSDGALVDLVGTRGQPAPEQVRMYAVIPTDMTAATAPESLIFTSSPELAQQRLDAVGGQAKVVFYDFHPKVIESLDFQRRNDPIQAQKVDPKAEAALPGIYAVQGEAIYEPVPKQQVTPPQEVMDEQDAQLNELAAKRADQPKLMASETLTSEPLVLYHGNYGGRAAGSGDLGVHYTEDPEVAAKKGEVEQVTKTFTNVLQVPREPENGAWHSPIRVIQVLEEAGVAMPQALKTFSTALEEQKPIVAGSENMEPAQRSALDKISQILQEQGYDAVAYPNQYEGGGTSYIELVFGNKPTVAQFASKLAIETPVREGVVAVAPDVLENNYVKRMKNTLQKWVKIFSPKMKILIIGEADNTISLGRIIPREDGTVLMELPPRKNKDDSSIDLIIQTFILAHEFGHALVFYHFKAAPQEVQDQVQQEWLDLIADIPNMTAAQYLQRWGNPGRLHLRDVLLAQYDVQATEPAQKLIDAIDANVGIPGYATSFDEYLAEQFARYVGKHTEKTFPRGTTLDFVLRDIVAKVKDFFDRIVSKLQVPIKFEKWVDGLSVLGRKGGAPIKFDLTMVGDEELKMATIQAKPGVNFGRLNALLGAKLYGNPSDIATVSVKEMVQNSFDAVKASLERGEITQGLIDITVDKKRRTITINDNGRGMPPEVLANQFLQLAGTSKESARASGGLGIAKGLFLYGNAGIYVETTRDGVTSELNTTGELLMEAAADPTLAPRIEVEVTPQAENGTMVEVKIPESYVDPSTGAVETIDIDEWLYSYQVLTKSPLLENVKVIYNKQIVPDMGATFKKDDYGVFANVQFQWGTASVYVSKKEIPQSGNNTHILSNGLWQFSKAINSNPADPWSEGVPRKIYVNISPAVRAEDPGYPFDLNRQRFSQQADADFEALFRYLAVTYRKQEMSEGVKNFGEMTYVNAQGGIEAPTLIAPPQIEELKKEFFTITEGDQIEVLEGKLIVNGREVPLLTKDDLKKAKVDINDFRIDQGIIDPEKIIVHDNVLVPKKLAGGGEEKMFTLSELGFDSFGDRFGVFLFRLGEVFKVMARRATQLHKDSGLYEELNTYGVGISFDKEYIGVHTRAPFKSILFNPAYPESDYADENGYAAFVIMIHELAHLPQRSHDADFVSELQKLLVKFEVSEVGQAIKKELVEIYSDNMDIVKFLRGEIYATGAIARGKHFKDGDKQASGRERPSSFVPVGDRTERVLAIPGGISGGNQVFAAPQTPTAESGELVAKKLYSAPENLNASGVISQEKFMRDKDPFFSHAFMRLQGFYNQFLQLNQMSKLLPNFEPLTNYRRAMQKMANLKNRMLTGPDARLVEWDRLSKEQSNGVDKFLKDEVNHGEHWTEMVELPTEIQGVTKNLWTHVPSEEFNTQMLARGLKEDAAKLIIGIKNDFLFTLQSMEEVLKSSVDSYFKGNPLSAQLRRAEIHAEFEKLRKVPYLPDRRFGQWAVYVHSGIDANINGREIKKGELVYWAAFESKSSRDKHFAELEAEYKDHRVSTGYREQVTRVTQGLPRSFVNDLVKVLALDPTQVEAIQKLQYDHTKSGAYEKLLRREKKFVGGASEDIRRSYGDYHWHAANHIAKLQYSRELQRAMRGVAAAGKNTKHSDPYNRLHEYLRKNFDYVMQPQDEWERLRSAVSLWYLWGSAKTALINGTSVATLTYPHLAAAYGDLQATASIMRAIKEVAMYWKNPKLLREDKQRVLQQATYDGVTDQSFAADMAGAADGHLMERMYPEWKFLKNSDASKTVRKATRRILDMGMKPFRTIEQLNRQITLLAAYDLEVTKSKRPFSTADMHSYMVARDAVDYTQNEFAPWNKPPVLRGKKSVFLIFYSFVQNMSFFMFGGDKGWWRAMFIMMALAGLQGIPGIENLIDMLNWAWKKFSGEHIDLRLEAREVAQTIGLNPDLAMHGISRNLLGWSADTSIGMGRIIPGTDAIFGEGDVDQRLMRAVSEVGGPAASLFMSFVQGLADEHPDALMRFDRVLPPALRNLERAYRYGTEGVKTRDGATLLHDPTTGELVGTALGFAPTVVATEQERMRVQRDVAEYYIGRRKVLLQAHYLAKLSGDLDVMSDVKERIAEFNANAPEKSLVISPREIALSYRARDRLRKKIEAEQSPIKRYQQQYQDVAELFGG